jgi:hypothetical protein
MDNDTSDKFSWHGLHGFRHLGRACACLRLTFLVDFYEV